jgi:2-dehydropantoate 2-reductase
VINKIPVAGQGTKPYDFIIVATKNCPDIHPTVSELIAPAITPSYTTILLLQNGLNIEVPLIAAFPTNAILSGVSLIGATETAPGVILHDDSDKLIISPYQNSGVSPEVSITAAKKFVRLYAASGKVKCEYNENVGFVRWRKLVYNASYNGLCAITRMDTSAMRYAKFPIKDLVRPTMLEICAIAKAAGHTLPEEVIENMINADPADTWFKPSMQQDVEKVLCFHNVQNRKKY